MGPIVQSGAFYCCERTCTRHLLHSPITVTIFYQLPCYYYAYIVLITCTCYFLSDVDECKIDLAQCGDSAYCTNTVGSYICNCKQGYVGIGNECNGEYVKPIGIHYNRTWTFLRWCIECCFSLFHLYATNGKQIDLNVTRTLNPVRPQTVLFNRGQGHMFDSCWENSDFIFPVFLCLGWKVYSPGKTYITRREERCVTRHRTAARETTFLSIKGQLVCKTSKLTPWMRNSSTQRGRT